MTTLADLAELVRAPAALSVPGDVIAGAAAAGALSPRTPALAGASVLLYWAGMAANDWADRRLDAEERPERPIPSGRVTPAAAVGLAAGLTAAGVGLAAAVGGRRAAALAVPLAATIWGYDLLAKNTAAGPAVMAACRGLDVLLGASGGRLTRALPAAATVAAHTWTVTALSRREVTGADATLPMRTLAGTALVAASAAVAAPGARRAAARSAEQAGVTDRAGATDRAEAVGEIGVSAGRGRAAGIAAVLPAVLAGWYAARYGAAQAQVVRDPSAGRVRAAVGAGITGLPALQGALTARGGAGLLGVAVAAAAPLGRRLARKVSPT
ncbi:SCO3242 family prenyltransferase [Micromonospora parva]|uniref:SCO3242 family prenyltransferase n=1 Tax=Micromonospora parva TaxID=1464048 RepID=A0ABW6VZX2_9ACTN|nr:UbiA family prenyltransferase [Micromonospora sp. C97]MBQ1030582.1 UbiA family prenyltransferase [Micromonospora sp. C97]